MKNFFLILTILSFVLCGPPKPDSNKADTKSKSEDTTMTSVEDLIKSLDSTEWNTRSSAIAELGSRREKKAIPKLRELLKNDTSPIVKASAATALGDMQDKESTIAISNLLQSNKDVPAESLIDALSRMGDNAGSNAVVPFLNSDIHAIRLQAVEALVNMKAKNRSKEILSLAKSNKDIEKAKTFAMAIGKLEIKDGESYLLNLATTVEPSPTLAATYLALGRIGSVKAVPILAKAVGGEFDKGRENSTESLVLIKDKSALPLMFPYLENKNLEIRYYAGRVIYEIPDASSAPKVLELLSKKKLESVGVCSFVLGRLKYEAARGKIEEILKDKAFPERENIAASLGWIGNKKSVPVLIEVLSEKDGEGKYGAAWALGILESEDAAEALMKASESSDGKLAAISIESLGHLKSDKILDFLSSLIEKNKNIALFALPSIGNIPGDKSIKVLEKFSSRKEPEIYRPAIDQLGKRRSKESIPLLIQMLKDRDNDRNKIVVSALSSITGEKFFTTTEWLNWYENKK